MTAGVWEAALSRIPWASFRGLSVLCKWHVQAVPVGSTRSADDSGDAPCGLRFLSSSRCFRCAVHAGRRLLPVLRCEFLWLIRKNVCWKNEIYFDFYFFNPGVFFNSKSRIFQVYPLMRAYKVR